MFENELARCIYHWLNYKDSTCKTSLLAESSIRYPLAEFLERKLSANVVLEENHPLFKKRRFDFSYDHKLNGKKRKGFIEIKVVRKNTKEESEIQRIFNDLMRLAYCSTSNYNYFILCGKTTDFNCFFKNELTKTSSIDEILRRTPSEHQSASGIYSNWFAFERGCEKSFKPSAFPQHEVFYRKYCWRENVEQHNLSSIKTTLIESLPRGFETNKSQCVYVWRVKGVKLHKREMD